MAEHVKGIAVAVSGVGIVFAYSGIKGISVTQSLQYLLTGKNPETLSQSNPISIPSDQNSAGSAGVLSGGAPGGSASANQAIARQLAASYGWDTGANWNALVTLWNGESGWSNTAENPSSGAYGIPQALPYSKMPKAAWPASAGGSSNASAQISWGLNYIKSVYGSPSQALSAWESRSPHWY